jgi:hypothetical protein
MLATRDVAGDLVEVIGRVYDVINLAHHCCSARFLKDAPALGFVHYFALADRRVLNTGT